MRIQISDHALIRYIERVKGVSLRATREKMKPLERDVDLVAYIEIIHHYSLERSRDEIKKLVADNLRNKLPAGKFSEGVLIILECLSKCPTVVTVLANFEMSARNRVWHQKMIYIAPDIVTGLRAIRERPISKSLPPPPAVSNAGF